VTGRDEKRREKAWKRTEKDALKGKASITHVLAVRPKEQPEGGKRDDGGRDDR
jgi:hypothetical protein